MSASKPRSLQGKSTELEVTLSKALKVLSLHSPMTKEWGVTSQDRDTDISIVINKLFGTQTIKFSQSNEKWNQLKNMVVLNKTSSK